MTSTEKTAPDLVFSYEQAAELQRLWGSMPYGGGLTSPRDLNVSWRGDANPVQPERVLEWLTGLSSRLREAADREAALRTELIELREDRRAIRRFLGLPLTATTDADPTAIH